ncbi:hypothetical protein [Burkholderia pseudomallei]|uniref:hypothetical protein n=1 Tax=Burkholderia pseudomallei TaxID=28450 RepID=UPI001E35585A|nr:hypothetical protein [Burkholderia pseudomallei]
MFSLYHWPPYGGGKRALPEYSSRVHEYFASAFGSSVERDDSMYDDAFAMRACACAIVGLPSSASSISFGNCGSPNWFAQSSDGHWPPCAGRLRALSNCAAGAIALSLLRPK